MRSLETALRVAGFKDVKAYDYASTRDPIAKTARLLASRIRQDWRDRPLHAVTHSLGGIVLRHIRDDRIRWRRIVMLAPPNQGSAVAASMADSTAGGMFGFVFGPAGRELAGASSTAHAAALRRGDWSSHTPSTHAVAANRDIKHVSKPKPWPFPPAPFGVIAGTRQRDLSNPTSILVSHRVFDEGAAHDGTVSVDETKLDGMAAFTTVDASHTTIMDEVEVHRQVVAFLRRGVFEPRGARDALAPNKI
jgi:hypothetical protein